mmetsp:Transcript_26425/g.23365  ORF Transcript_26425/g.23365 Transcript_26425/m.23365 type:complete len:124 (-) Transcript_26425:172-543(-)
MNEGGIFFYDDYFFNNSILAQNNSLYTAYNLIQITAQTSITDTVMTLSNFTIEDFRFVSYQSLIQYSYYNSMLSFIIGNSSILFNDINMIGINSPSFGNAILISAFDITIQNSQFTDILIEST